MAEQRVANVGHHAFADPHDEVEAHGRAQRQHHDDRQHGEEVFVDEGRVVGGEAVVDDAAHGDRNRQRGTGGGQKCDQRQDHLAPIGAEEGREAQEGAEVPALRAAPGLVFIGVAHDRCSSR